MPDLTLIGGLRYDRERIDNEAVGLGGPFQAKDEYSELLPKAGIVYDISDSLSVGFTAQKGYRAGGVVQDFAGATDAFDPESTWNYEGSIRSQWLDGRMTANANVFYTDWSDQQVFQLVGPPGFVDVTNASESRLRGAEAELNYQTAEGLELFGSVAYVDTEFTDFIAFGQDFSGNEFNFAPKVTVAVGGTYRLPNGFFVSADASHQGKSYSDFANTTEIDERTLVNTRIGYSTDGFEVFAFARNLFDEDYVISRTTNASGTASVPGEPFTFGVVGQIRF
jgi:outer membrane receptor protein involved in Fe transport